MIKKLKVPNKKKIYSQVVISSAAQRSREIWSISVNWLCEPDSSTTSRFHRDSDRNDIYRILLGASNNCNDSDSYVSTFKVTTLIFVVLALLVFRASGQVWAGAGQAVQPDNFRRPASDDELNYWLKNMVWYHHFTNAEITAAMGLTSEEIFTAMKKFNIRPDNRTELNDDSHLIVLPYPGGRHPRIGFLEGAINPQRETKFSVFTPWDRDSYIVVDVPEAIWSNLGLTYLAHTHIDTIWTKKGIILPKLEWKRHPDGTLDIERILPNKITFGVKVKPTKEAVRMEMWLKNGTEQRLTDLRIQNCVMTKMTDGFEQQTNDNKIFTNPYVACRSEDGKRWIITAWENCYNPWGNEKCPCFHSDPKFPDLEPGQSYRLRGWLSFYEGKDIEKEFKRIEATGWRKRPESE
jgi:hypothetical protein